MRWALLSFGFVVFLFLVLCIPTAVTLNVLRQAAKEEPGQTLMSLTSGMSCSSVQVMKSGKDIIFAVSCGEEDTVKGRKKK